MSDEKTVYATESERYEALISREDYQHNIQLYAENADLLSIPSGGATPGEGYILPVFFNIGGPQRITVQLDIADLRRDGDKTILLVEHNMDVVMNVSEAITVMHQGEVLAEGNPADIAANELVQKAYLGELYKN